MPITLPSAPTAGLDLIRATVPFLIDQDGVISARQVLRSRLKVARPHPIHVITAAEFLKQDLLAGAELKGWQYPLVSDRHTFASGEVSHAENAVDMMFTTLRYRAYVLPIVDALRVAESLPAVAQNDYELRMLRAPGMSLRAVWLCREGQDDILIPIASAPKPLVANQTLTKQQLKDALKPLAQSRLGMQLHK